MNSIKTSIIFFVIFIHSAVAQNVSTKKTGQFLKDTLIYEYEKICKDYDHIFIRRKILEARIHSDKSSQEQIAKELSETILKHINQSKNKDAAVKIEAEEDICSNTNFNNRIKLIKKFKEQINLFEDSIRLYSEKLKALENKKENTGKAINSWIMSAHPCGYFKMKIRGVNYKIFIADTSEHMIDLNLYNRKDSTYFYTLNKLKIQLNKQYSAKVEMCTNGGMFMHNHNPEGLYISSTRDTFFDIDLGPDNPDLNFYMKPNGVFYCDKNGMSHIIPTEYWKGIDTSKVRCATQSGPLLINKGIIHKRFNHASESAKIRSGVGVMGDKDQASKTIFAITTNESNFMDFSEVFKYILCCDDALFLDGAISKMNVKEDKEWDNSQFGPLISVVKK